MVPKSVFAFVLIAMMVSAAYAPSVPYTLLWSDPVAVVDIAVSEDGRYVAVVSDSLEGGQVRFYDRTSANPKTPIWSVPNPLETTIHFYSVAISADGDSVAAGFSNIGFTGYGVAYWKNARSVIYSGETTSWESKNLLGAIRKRALDMSDDGNYVVACGTGTSVYYWADAKTKSGLAVDTSWTRGFAPNVEAVDVSSDGDYVVAGVGPDVAYWKGAKALTGSAAPFWTALEPDAPVVAVAVSDDGNYVAAATGTDNSVHYWAGAKSLGTNPPSTWWGGEDVSFTSLDMSSDGNSVIAGSGSGIYFWSGATTLTGKPQNPSWTYPTSTVSEVAIDDAGDYMAAANSLEQPHIVYFLDSSGNAKWTYQVDLHVNALSISSDGGTLAVGTGPLRLTAYLFDTGFPIHVGAPVGGFMEPVNKLGTVAPYLALFGVVAAVAVVVVKPWKKRET